MRRGFSPTVLLFLLSVVVPQNFWTVPEVISEIRDKKARHHLESLPFELKLREPSSEAMKFGEARELASAAIHACGQKGFAPHYIRTLICAHAYSSACPS